MNSPLLTGYKTNTPLDLITYNLYFLFPLTQEQVNTLNTVIYSDEYFHINYWSLTHLFGGIIWGILNYFYPKIFSLTNYIILHTIFEIWELHSIHLPLNELTIQEIIDIIMDTIFGVVGFLLIKLFLQKIK